ncbi:MAG TPA: hypothetical protein VE462_14615 [Propionibacteriaceae bacterium]|jgi:integrase|nr:hypothetical protein [Propionibacteriaceae bacterium]
MAGRRTKRSDGRFCLNITIENADGTKRRVYFYGRTQADAKAKVAAARERVGHGEPVRDATRTLGHHTRAAAHGAGSAPAQPP